MKLSQACVRPKFVLQMSLRSLTLRRFISIQKIVVGLHLPDEYRLIRLYAPT